MHQWFVFIWVGFYNQIAEPCVRQLIYHKHVFFGSMLSLCGYTFTVYVQCITVYVHSQFHGSVHWS